MPNFRRARVPGGTFFFTVVTDHRAPILCDPTARRILREVLRRCRARWPMAIDALVLLPDHLHTIWTLPADDTSYSTRWGWMKREFTRQWLDARKPEQHLSAGRRSDRRRGVWQPKFWEHALRDERDLRRHMDYIHYNPVKHGLVRCPHEWRWSSFGRWVRHGVYPLDWACSCGQTELWQLDLRDVEATAKE